MSYNDGFLPCRKVVVDEIVVGNMTVKNAEIGILSENSPYLRKNQHGQIGMWHFRDTVVVLDFERSLMWVKNDGQ